MNADQHPIANPSLPITWWHSYARHPTAILHGRPTPRPGPSLLTMAQSSILPIFPRANIPTFPPSNIQSPTFQTLNRHRIVPRLLKFKNNSIRMPKSCALFLEKEIQKINWGTNVKLSFSAANECPTARKTRNWMMIVLNYSKTINPAIEPSSASSPVRATSILHLVSCILHRPQSILNVQTFSPSTLPTFHPRRLFLNQPHLFLKQLTRRILQ
jgi:hypothetical protein